MLVVHATPQPDHKARCDEFIRAVSRRIRALEDRIARAEILISQSRCGGAQQITANKMLQVQKESMVQLQLDRKLLIKSAKALYGPSIEEQLPIAAPRRLGGVPILALVASRDVLELLPVEPESAIAPLDILAELLEEIGRERRKIVEAVNDQSLEVAD